MSRTGGRGWNWILWLSTVAVAAVGLVNLSSAARTAETNLAVYQGIWMAVGLAAALLLSVLDYRILFKLAYPSWLLSLLLLGLVLVTGRVISGSQRWLHLGPVNFQPSELAKLTLILALARYFSDEEQLPSAGYTLRKLVNPLSILYPLGGVGALLLFWEKLAQLGGWRVVILVGCLLWATVNFLLNLRVGNFSWHRITSPVLLLLAPCVLILRQPDLGTTLVLAAIAGSMLLFVGVRRLSLVVTVVITIVLAVVAWSFVLHDYQKKRVLAFLEPEADIKESGYHAWQSRIAVGSGQMHGKGWRQSTQTRFRFLPEQHTDFVFSVWAEEWGFVGSVVALFLFFFWMLQLLNCAASARDLFGALVGVGFTAMVFWHVVINIGMVIGLLPVVGITLPLWSYGGSSVLLVMCGVGICASIHRHRYQF